MEWISVKDKLPFEGQSILTWDGHVIGKGDFYCHKLKKWRMYEYGDGEVIDVPNPITHWALLPDPPN